jgi:hypothetical protein
MIRRAAARNGTNGEVTPRMDDPHFQSIETAFARAEADAEAALKAAAGVVSVLRRYRSAASQGKVGDLRSAGEAAAQSLQTLDQAITNLAQSWDFDAQAYLGSGDYARELVRSAEQADVRVTELDGRLYCYPALIRVLPDAAAVQIDKQRERRIRPSVLVRHLRDLQRRPPRFRTTEFLEALYSVYEMAIKLKPRRSLGSVVALTELYDLLTKKPGDKREYTRQEFARDIYLLDRSAETTTRAGARLEFHAGAGARLPAGSVLSVVTQQGVEKRYHGIAFTASDDAG